MHDFTPTASVTEPRHAIVGVVGRTNSGKSTLINQLIGEKVSIVSPITQTTRNTIRSIMDEPRGQLVLVDTPGLHKAVGPLGTQLNRMARHAAANVEILLLVFDGSHKPELEDDGWMRRLLFADQPCLFLLNKADRTEFYPDEFKELWKSIQDEKKTQREIPWFEASAATGAGLKPLVDALFQDAEPGERPYDPDILSDYPRRLAIADVIREQFLRYLKDELPHELGIRIDEMIEAPTGWQVEATILVNRPSQKPIVIGPKGHTIRKVKKAAQQEISQQYDVDISLSMWVKVERNWMSNFWILQQMGYAGEH